MAVTRNLAPAYLRDEIDRLCFHAPEEAKEESLEAVANVPLGPPVVHEASKGRFGTDRPIGNGPKISAKSLARHRGFEPLTYGSGVSKPPLGGSSSGSQVVGNVRGRGMAGVHGTQPLAGFRNSFAASLLHGSPGLRVVDRALDRLLTVRQVAERLGVSTAMVYALVARGELVHVRLSNAIRVAPAVVAAFIAARTTGGMHIRPSNRPARLTLSRRRTPR